MSTKITKALKGLQNAMEEAGIGSFQLRLLDIEDANKIKALFEEDVRAIRPPVGFNEKPVAFWCSITGVVVQWPNKDAAKHKDENFLERRRELARVETVKREAERMARNARSAYLAKHGISA